MEVGKFTGRLAALVGGLYGGEWNVREHDDDEDAVGEIGRAHV